MNPVLDYSQTLTVTSGQTTSPEIDLAGGQLVGIFVPSTFDGTTITITVSNVTGGTFAPVQNGAGNSSSFTITTAAGNFVPIDNLAMTVGLRFIKLVCGTAQATTDTIFTLARRCL